MNGFDPFKTYICTEDELHHLCRFWLKQLGLDNWHVALRITRANEFKTPGNQAEIEWVLPHAYATASILDHIDYPDGPFGQDHEVSLVHELLHLHTAPFDETKEGSLEEKAMERMIEMTARALVDLRRRGHINIGQEPQKEE